MFLIILSVRFKKASKLWIGSTWSLDAGLRNPSAFSDLHSFLTADRRVLRGPPFSDDPKDGEEDQGADERGNDFFGANRNRPDESQIDMQDLKQESADQGADEADAQVEQPAVTSR